MFAVTENEPDTDRVGLNRALWLFVYAPYVVVFSLSCIGLLFIWKRFSSADVKVDLLLSARLRVLGTIKQYLAVQTIYTILVLFTYFFGWEIHTCDLDSAFVRGQSYTLDRTRQILQFPPACMSWQGRPCTSKPILDPTFSIVMQITFFNLFCLRGVPDVLTFLYSPYP